MSRVIVLSIGHTGSRIIGRVLKKSGFDTGRVNGSHDTVKFSGAHYKPAIDFAACASYRNKRWSWSPPPRPEGYLDDSPEAWKHGWPSLCMPWLLDRFPDARYIRWLRDPRDTVLWRDRGVEKFVANEVAGFEGLDYDEAAGQFVRYWWHQQVTYQPRFCLQLRYEDYVNDPEATTDVLSHYLGRRMAIIPVHSNSVGRWQDKSPPASSTELAAKEMYYAGDISVRVHPNV
jgi:hypothetical protein